MKKLLLYSLPFLIGACGSPKADENMPPTLRSVSDTITLSASQISQADMTTSVVTRESISSSVSCNGVIDVPPQYLADLNPPLPGYITEIRVKGGEKVKKGEVLALLEHPDYIELQRRYLEASSQLNFAETDFKRQQELLKVDATATKSFEKAQAEYQIQLAAVSALGAQLKRLGIRPDKLKAAELQQTISLTAPFDGFVVSVDGAIGRYVSSDRPLVQLINKDHLHIELQVFEQDLEKLKIAQKLNFTVLNASEKVYTGDVFLIGPTIDLQKRTSNVHAHIDGHSDFLRPGMYVKAEIFTEPREALTIDEEAVVTVGKDAFVFVLLQNGSYLRTKVRTGLAAKGRIVVLEGLTEKATVVRHGVQYVEGKYLSAAEDSGIGH